MLVSRRTSFSTCGTFRLVEEGKDQYHISTKTGYKWIGIDTTKYYASVDEAEKACAEYLLNQEFGGDDE